MTPTRARPLRPPTAGGGRADGRPGGSPTRGRHAPTASPPRSRSRPGASAAAAGLWLALAWALGPSATEPALAAEPRDLAARPAFEEAGTDYGVHVVRDGESFYSIARRYGMGVPQLAALNGMRPSGILLPGRGLRVPLEQAINARADQPAEAPAEGASTVAPLSEGASTTYLVRPGDTLFGIASRYGLDIEGLKARNGLPLDGSIRAGETLVLGDTMPTARPTEPASAAGGAGGASGAKTVTYVVQPGDTLTAIAQRYGATASALRAMNGLTGDIIAAGQRLRVPRQGSNAFSGVGAKRIEVDIGEQRMYVWEGGTLVFNWTISTGLATHPTRRGHFAVQSKVPNAWSSPWQLWMPNWLGIYWAGGSENGIHALPIVNGTRIWGGYLGSPISYGCVVLGTAESKILYDWADIGTPVEIHD